MAIIVTDCIVHDRKYLSKFHGTVNQLRQLNEFSNLILQQLPKRCCSCHNQTVYPYFQFSVEYLRKLCHQIESSQKTSPIISHPSKHIHYVVLEFPSMLNHIQRAYKAGRFVGRSGKNLQRLQCELGVCINIVNEKSNKHFRQIIDQLKQQNKQHHKNGLRLLISKKRGNKRKIDIEKVKYVLKKRWRKINVFLMDKRSIKNRSSRQKRTSQKIKRR